MSLHFNGLIISCDACISYVSSSVAIVCFALFYVIVLLLLLRLSSHQHHHRTPHRFFCRSVQGYWFCGAGGGVEICLFPQELKVAVNIVRLWCAFFTVVPQRCDKRIKLPMSSLSLVKRDVSSKSSFLLFQFCFKKNFYVYARHHRVHSTSVADPGLPFRWGQPLPLPFLSFSPPFPLPSLSTPFFFLYLSPPQL